MEQVASFKAFPHIGEKVFRFLVNQKHFKACLLVCKYWNLILSNPMFWLNKIKELNPANEIMNMNKWLNLILNLKDSNLAQRELAIGLREKYFFLPKRVDGQYPCQKCDRVFQVHKTLLAHQEKRDHFIQQQEQNFKCCPCLKSFKTYSNLMRHKLNFCECQFSSLEKLFYCENCKVIFRNQKKFTKHLHSQRHILKLEKLGLIPLGTADRIKTNFKCELCGNEYDESYKDHLRSRNQFSMGYESFLQK